MRDLLRRHPGVMTGAVLGATTFVTYAVCLGKAYPLASGDSILDLPLLSSWRHLPSIFSSDFMMFSEGQFRPTGYALLALLRSVIDADAVILWHLLLVALHWLNACLMAGLVRLITRHAWSPLFAGLLFAVHPVATVVVNDVTLFHHLLGLTFYLASLQAFLRPEPAHRSFPIWLVASVGLFLVGLTVSKLLFSLPLALVACEGYRRPGWRVAVARLSPFMVITLAAAPIWWLVKPHPLHFSYILFPPGATWFTFFSVVSATEWYARGLLLGWGIPVPLHEVVPQIYSATEPRLIGLVLILLTVLTAGLVLLRRRRWGGLGLVVLLAVMIPFASTTWNSVLDYVSWKYVYAALAGLALFLGWVIDELQSSHRLQARRIGVVLWLCLPVLAWQQIRVNGVSTSAVDYWEYVTTLNPRSEVGNVALGQALLARGDEDRARAHLFAPAVKQLYDSAATWCRYYTRKGDLLSAAIHLRMAVRRGSGLQFGYAEPLMAELMYAVGAHDHAEAALGKVLTANPYDIEAMALLATIWCDKGYIKAAEKLLRRAEELAPHTDAVRRMRLVLRQRQEEIPDDETLVDPPAPSWLRYATQGFHDARILEEIVGAGQDYPTDPVIQLEAAICLARGGRYQAARERLGRVTRMLPESAFAWAMRSWVAAELGSLDEAIDAGRHALDLDNRNATVHNTLGILDGRLAEVRSDDAFLRQRAMEHFREALRINPQHASAYVNLARELRHQGQHEKAMALYRRVLRLRPDLAEAHFNLGNLLAEQGDKEGAIDSYRQAIRARRDYVQAHFNLGVSEVERGDLIAARECFFQVLQLDEKFAAGRRALARVLIHQRDYRQAIDILTEGLTVNPEDTRCALMLASLLTSCLQTELRDAATAVTVARNACETMGNSNSEALLVLAGALAGTDNFDDALAVVDQALQVATTLGARARAAQVREGLRHRRDTR